MGPVLPVQTEMGQDESGEHLHHGSSERTRQGSFQQQRNRFEMIRMLFTVETILLFCFTASVLSVTVINFVFYIHKK